MVLMLDDFHSVHSLYTTVKLVKTSVVLLLSGCASYSQFSNRRVSSSHRRAATDVNGHQTICLRGLAMTSVLEMLTNALSLVNQLNNFIKQLPGHMQWRDPGRWMAALWELRLVLLMKLIKSSLLPRQTVHILLYLDTLFNHTPRIPLLLNWV